MTPLTALLVSLFLLVLSAFFVAVEFAVVAARRHRLEEAAPESYPARAALKSSRELSLLLAGSQLGITLCALGLGHFAEPAIEHLVHPLLAATGIPGQLSTAIGFLFALAVVTFLHMVVGEMAPKSWAISHPERSATLLAVPMRMFMRLTRPVLLLLNGAANGCLKLLRIDPNEEATSGHNPDDLRELVDHSAKAGALDEERRDQLAMALEVNSRPLRDVVTPKTELAAVGHDDRLETIEETARRTGHLRLVVRNGEEAVGVLHVRDALAAAAGTQAADIARPVLTLAATTPIYAALSIMRESRSHLALVETEGEVIGVATLQDLLDELLVTAP